MVREIEQLVDQLSCEDLYFLKDKEHFHNKRISKRIKEKCNL